MATDMIIQLLDVKQFFRINDRMTVKAIDGISFGIQKGEVFGLVGETGCGKSTVARVISGIYHPTEGEVLFQGECISGRHRSKVQAHNLQHEMQLIFQDSAASLNPRMTVEQIILEPLRIQGKRDVRADSKDRLESLMHDVGMSMSFLSKRPGELSGGQRQRVAIARSLILNPKLIVADEPIASLDISIQAQIMTLFQHLQRENDFSFLFIAHDLSVVRFISDRIGVMLHGKLVEIAATEELFSNPIHPYTRALLSAIPIPDPIFERRKTIQYYDTKTPLGTTMVEHSPGHLVLE